MDTLKRELSRRRPLTQGEMERLRHEFTVEYIYDSNAIEGSTLTLRETALVAEYAERSLREWLSFLDITCGLWQRYF
uniref:Uncharacterized protein n=1 Tax=termite gut metagenome TaxID=433724 RepID=S0DE18_9ZZZZ